MQTTFILKHIVIVNEGSYKLNALLGVFPFSLFNMFVAIRGVCICDLFMFPLWSTPIGGFLFLLGMGSIHLVPFFPPLSRVFFSLTFNRFLSSY